jgi:hypothetical protein
METSMDLEIGPDGMIVTRPVLGWTTAPAAGTAVIARIQYAERPEELQTGGKAIQFVLTPQQALELAEILTTQAQRILGQRPPGKTN